MVLVRIWSTFRSGFGPVLHWKVVRFWSYFGQSWSYLTNGSTAVLPMYQPIRVQYFTVGENSGTSKEAWDFKIDTELPGDLYTTFLAWNAPLTPVRNQACPLTTPWRTLWRHLGDGVLLMKLETSKLIQSFLETCILHSWRKIYHWNQSGTKHVI